jgi:hypothetical protein
MLATERKKKKHSRERLTPLLNTHPVLFCPILVEKQEKRREEMKRGDEKRGDEERR